MAGRSAFDLFGAYDEIRIALHQELASKARHWDQDRMAC